MVDRAACYDHDFVLFRTLLMIPPYSPQEHHLQRAICAGLIIPTPEVFETECEFYERTYPNNYKMPRQMIHMQRK